PSLIEGNRALKPFLDYSKVIEDIADDEEPNVKSNSTDSEGTPPGAPQEETAEDRLNYLMKTPEVKAGLQAFDVATSAFQNKDYELAVQKTEEALQQLPYDSALHEFRALVLFARGEFQPAAAT